MYINDIKCVSMCLQKREDRKKEQDRKKDREAKDFHFLDSC